MFDHKYFRQLSSLAASGQLTAHENEELTRHLMECEKCLAIHDEYSHLVQHQFPQAHLTGWGTNSLPSGLPPASELRDKFLGRARAEGACFSLNAERPTWTQNSQSTSSKQMLSWQYAVIAATCAAVALFGIWFSRNYQIRARSVTIAASVSHGGENANLKDEIRSLRQANQQNSEVLTRLRQEMETSQALVHKSQEDLRESQILADKLLAENQAAKSQNEILGDTNQQKDTMIASLRTQNEEADRLRTDNLADLVIQRQRNLELTESLNQRTSDLERERQLESATDDVRQLMGARNLHIIDVHDINVDSRSAKSFGRVFYAEGQSLVFYAFDLPSSGFTPAKYTFQAWGGRDSSSKVPRNLGTFEVDDHEQHRWVLKVNNPRLLAGIESVFVTAESIRDAKSPGGNKLLYAYIAGQPNHP